MSAEHNISPQDYELLSAYIDNELSEIERATLEQRLSNEPRLSQELDSLRNTVSLINQLPSMTAPRDFTITESMVKPANVIALRPRPRQYTPYLSLVASITLMIFGVMFMLSDLAPNQTSFTGESEAIQQSEPATGNLGEIAAIPTSTSTDENNQADRARVEPQTEPNIQEETTETEEEEPVADLAALQAPANAPMTGDAAVESEALDNEFALAEDTGTGQTDGLDKVSDNDDSMADELQMMDTEMGDEDSEGLFETTAEDIGPPSEPQAMAGASFAEPATDIAPDSTGSTDDFLADGESAESQAVDENTDPADIVTDITKADTSETMPQEQRDIPTPTLQAPPPSTPVSEVTPESSNNLPIGIGLLAIGVILLTASLVMIRRHRS